MDSQTARQRHGVHRIPGKAASIPGRALLWSWRAHPCGAQLPYPRAAPARARKAPGIRTPLARLQLPHVSAYYARLNERPGLVLHARP